MKMFSSERGQGLVEYVLILILIAIVVILAMTALGLTVESMFSDAGSAIDALS